MVEKRVFGDAVDAVDMSGLICIVGILDSGWNERRGGFCSLERSVFRIFVRVLGVRIVLGIRGLG